MSACLFTWRVEDFTKASADEILDSMKEWDRYVCEDFPEIVDPTRFEGDKFAGYSYNLQHASYFLAGVERGAALGKNRE